MTVAVLGLGYVGLVLAVGLAAEGHRVYGFDRDLSRADRLRAGEVPFFEPGLSEALKAVGDHLRVVASLADAVEGAEVVFLAVGTPSDEDGRADLTALYAVADALAPHLRPGVPVILKSTVPVGTGRRLAARLTAAAGFQVFTYSNPEFLAEGTALRDWTTPDRILLGGEGPGMALLEALYAPWAARGVPVLCMTQESAELAKYAANAMLAMRVALINEIAELCERAGGDVVEIARAVGMDPRIGPSFLRAGPGFGGSCFPKDLAALGALGTERDLPLPVVRAAAVSNDRARSRIAARLLEELPPGARVALWGMAFKAGTDDVRASPAGVIARTLLDAGVEVIAWDPEARPDATFAGITLAKTPLDAVDGADALVLATEWEHFQKVEPREVARRMRGRLVYDGRNALNPEAWKQAGLRYRGVGRPDVESV